MKTIKLDINRSGELLKLEEQMYWQSEKWNKLWQGGAKEKFKTFIKDYLTNFPQGCFGLVDNGGTLLGAMFLLKTSKHEPVPYLHKPNDNYDKEGVNAYVSFFVVNKGKDEEEIAQKLYDEAEEIALLKLQCKKIIVTIYSSFLEERILIGNNYEKQPQQYEWEIYPGTKVSSWVYLSSLLMTSQI